MRVVKIVKEGLDSRFRADMAKAVETCTPVQVELGNWRGGGWHAKAAGWAQLATTTVRVLGRRELAIGNSGFASREC